MFEIEPDNIVIAQNSKLKSIFYVVDGLLIAEAGFQTDCTRYVVCTMYRRI